MTAEVSTGLTVEVQLADEVSVESDTLEQIRYWALTALALAPDSSVVPSGANSDQARAGELVIRLVAAEEIRALNSDYRGKDVATNVLSFPMNLPEGYGGDECLLGDMAICLAVVEREAREQGKQFADHLAHMVVHGCLHVLGFDHQSSAEAHEMESLEVELLSRFEVSDPYEIDQ